MAQNRSSKSPTGTFTRGSELWWHQARLVLVAARTTLLAGLFAGLCGGIGYMHFKASDDDIRKLYGFSISHLWGWIGLPGAHTTVYVNGIQRVIPAESAVAQLTPYMTEPRRLAYNATVLGGSFFLASTILIGVGLYLFGKRKMMDENLRGSSLAEKEDLIRALKANDDVSPYTIAGVPVRKGAETLHFLFAGAQGTGKSQQFFELLDQIKARGKRAIIFDPSGEFTATYYREGKDIIMNPLDARSPHWTVWNDVHEDIHYDNIANGLIPEPAGAQSDPFWIKAGRNVLKDTMKVLGKEGKRTNKALYEAISLNGLQALNTLLAGTPGATYTAPETERTGMSLKMTVQNQLECFRFLSDEGTPFSIRKWIKEEGDSWMFISTREAQMDAIRPLLSLWLYIAIQSVLDLEPIHRERLWFMVDEFPRLQKMDTMELALTNTRKYGLCMVLGLQDFGQLREKYGANIAQTIVSQCQTKLILRISDGRAAKALSELLGQAEVDEKEETLSYGLNSQRDGVSVYAKRQLRDMVLSSEILYLPDMTGYITTPGPYPVAKVAYRYKKRERIAPGFVERKLPGSPDDDPEGTPPKKPVTEAKQPTANAPKEVVRVEEWIDEETGKKLTEAEIQDVIVGPNEKLIVARGPWAGAI